MPLLAAADPILIEASVPQELAPIREVLAGKSSETFDGIRCELGALGRHHVIVAMTGIGKTNGALVTSAVIGRFHPDRAFWTGTAARVRKSVRVGDLIIAGRVMNYDVGVLTRGGMQYGVDSGGVSSADKPWYAPPFLGPDGLYSTPNGFDSDPGLVRLALEFAKDYHPESISLHGVRYTPVIRRGFIVSGDLYGLTEVMIADIRRKLDPDLLQVEGAAVAQVCLFYRVPLLVVCGGSDELREDNPNEYAEVSPIAAREAALFTRSLIAALP
jgi:adenosylhomocysteine nucleosidase